MFLITVQFSRTVSVEQKKIFQNIVKNPNSTNLVFRLFDDKFVFIQEPLDFFFFS